MVSHKKRKTKQSTLGGGFVSRSRIVESRKEVAGTVTKVETQIPPLKLP